MNQDGLTKILKRGIRQSKALHPCRFCPKEFKKHSQLVRHERIHTGDKPFKCDTCSQAFNQKNSLEIHRRTHTGDKPHKCDVCQMGFTQARIFLNTSLLPGEAAFPVANEISRKLESASILFMRKLLSLGKIHCFESVEYNSDYKCIESRLKIVPNN